MSIIAQNACSRTLQTQLSMFAARLQTRDFLRQLASALGEDACLKLSLEGAI